MTDYDALANAFTYIGQPYDVLYPDTPRWAEFAKLGKPRLAIVVQSQAWFFYKNGRFICYSNEEEGFAIKPERRRR